MANYRWGSRTISKELREQILQTYLDDPTAGTNLALSHSLSPAYAYRLANERGLLPRIRKEWGSLRETQ